MRSARGSPPPRASLRVPRRRGRSPRERTPCSSATWTAAQRGARARSRSPPEPARSSPASPSSQRRWLRSASSSGPRGASEPTSATRPPGTRSRAGRRARACGRAFRAFPSSSRSNRTPALAAELEGRIDSATLREVLARIRSSGGLDRAAEECSRQVSLAQELIDGGELADAAALSCPGGPLRRAPARRGLGAHEPRWAGPARCPRAARAAGPRPRRARTASRCSGEAPPGPPRAVAGAVDAVGDHRLVGVGDGEDRGLQRDLVLSEALRVAGPVGALVVGEDPLADVGELLAREDSRAELGVALHLVVLGRGQRPGLAEDRVGHADLADVVEDPREPDALDPGLVEPELVAIISLRAPTVWLWRAV